MNEQKKLRYEHFNPKVSESQQSAEELIALISSFIHNTKLKSGDWIALTVLLKQLKKNNTNLPRKVLRSVQNKFQTIQQNYIRR